VFLSHVFLDESDMCHLCMPTPSNQAPFLAECGLDCVGKVIIEKLFEVCKASFNSWMVFVEDRVVTNVFVFPIASGISQARFLIQVGLLLFRGRSAAVFQTATMCKFQLW